MTITIGNEPVAQGDLLIRRVETIPETATPLAAENGRYVLAHSETGHHHAVMEREDVKFYQDAEDATVAYLEVIANDVKVEHLRSFDTHAPYTLPPGRYELRRQIESAPEGFQRVID